MTESVLCQIQAPNLGRLRIVQRVAHGEDERSCKIREALSTEPLLQIDLINGGSVM